MKVELHSLSKSYDNGRSYAVQDFSLAMPAGEITALLGPSGCGKTTLLKMIAGLLPPTHGDICFDGRSVLAIPAEKRQAVMVFQNHLLFPNMNVAENVGFGLKMRGTDKAIIAQRVRDLLELVHLAGYENRRPQALSGGQQQRVALARALIVQPDLLLLDEPLASLDAHLKDEMRELIRHIQQKMGITTIVVTHDQQTAVILADQIALLLNGHLQQVGPPRDFYERPSSTAVARFFGGVNFLPATKQGPCLHTPWGDFTAPPSPLCDGPVQITIRPEQIQLLNGSTSPTHNRLPATLLSQVYAGTFTRFKLQAGYFPLEAISTASLSHPLQAGDVVTLHLPPEKIWLLPADKEQA